LSGARPHQRVISLGRAQIVGLTCLPLLIFALLFARFSSNQRVLGGVSVAGVDLGGQRADEARRHLLERARALSAEKLQLVLGAKSASLTVEELGAELVPADSATRAMAEGRSSNTPANALRYLRSWFGQNALPGVVRIDPARFAAALAKIEPALVDDAPFAGGIAFENGAARALPPRAGRKIALDAAKSAVSAAVSTGHVRTPVVLSAQTVTPQLAAGSLERALAQAERALRGTVVLEAAGKRLELPRTDLSKVLSCSIVDNVATLVVDRPRLDAWLESRRAELESPAKDAKFEVSAQDEVRVVPAETGLRLDGDALSRTLLAVAQSDDQRGELPLLHEPEPARTTEQAEKLGIRKLVSAFTTRHVCCQPRVDNIHRIATILDGLVVEPGQEVSVNALVGPRTQKNGFVLAPSIEDGEMVDTVGGGVSQFATTLFNALFRGGYDIIERKPHTYWFTRYPMGIEATLSWPHPDIVFKNDSAAGMLVKTSFTDTTITVKLYGDVGGRRVVTNVSERRDIVQPVVELLPNRAVPPDEEKVKEGGMIGWSVIVSRTVTFADGTKKEDKRKVTYKPKPRRVDVHPCRIPKGEPGATGEPCPEIEKEEDEEKPAEEPAQAG